MIQTFIQHGTINRVGGWDAVAQMKSLRAADKTEELKKQKKILERLLVLFRKKIDELLHLMHTLAMHKFLDQYMDTYKIVVRDKIQLENRLKALNKLIENPPWNIKALNGLTRTKNQLINLFVIGKAK
jgi:succinate dehydrogenase/fumarate reductase flavoprotein subunit